MSIIGDIAGAARIAGETRRLAGAVKDLLNMKEKFKMMAIQINKLEADRKALVAAINRHEAEMKEEDSPRRWKPDEKLYEFVKKYEDPMK